MKKLSWVSISLLVLIFISLLGSIFFFVKKEPYQFSFYQEYADTNSWEDIKEEGITWNILSNENNVFSVTFFAERRAVSDLKWTECITDTSGFEIVFLNQRNIENPLHPYFSMRETICIK